MLGKIERLKQKIQKKKEIKNVWIGNENEKKNARKNKVTWKCKIFKSTNEFLILIL